MPKTKYVQDYKGSELAAFVNDILYFVLVIKEKSKSNSKKDQNRTLSQLNAIESALKKINSDILPQFSQGNRPNITQIIDLGFSLYTLIDLFKTPDYALFSASKKII